MNLLYIEREYKFKFAKLLGSELSDHEHMAYHHRWIDVTSSLNSNSHLNQ